MNSNNLVVIDGNLKVGDIVISFDWPVVQVLKLDNMILVRVESPAGVIFNRNIYALDDRGRIKWQIAESPHGGGNDKPYMNMSISDNEIIASNWNGIDYVVNPDNGDIEVKTFGK